MTVVPADVLGDVFGFFTNILGGAASSAAGDIITVFAKAILGSLTQAVEWLATVWIGTPTPTIADATGSATGTTAWLQGELLPITASLAVLSVLIGGARIAYAEHGAGEAREFTKWLFCYVVASAGGVALAALVINTCDVTASYVITQSTHGQNFGDHLAQGLGLVTQATGSLQLPGTPPRLISGGAPKPGTRSKVAASGAWMDPTTFQIMLRYYETPHHDTVTCRFDGAAVRISFLSSIARMSAAKDSRPTLQGKMAG